MLQKLKGLPWSAFCNLGFIVLGAFQLFPGKFPALAINQALGGSLFVVVFAVQLFVHLSPPHVVSVTVKTGPE